MSRSQVSAHLKERGFTRGLTTLRVDVLKHLLSLIEEGDMPKASTSKAELTQGGVFGRRGQDGVFRIVDRRHKSASRGKMPQYMTTQELREVLSYLGWEVPELKFRDQLMVLAVARLKAQGMVLGENTSVESISARPASRSASPSRALQAYGSNNRWSLLN